MGLILYLDFFFLVTANRNSFIQRKEIKGMDDFLIAAESEKSLDFSQNISVKVTAITPATVGKSLSIFLVTNPAHLCQS